MTAPVAKKRPRFHPCPTLARLVRLTPGERMIYYTGDFEEDIFRAERGSHRRDGIAPAYAALLRTIRETAEDLAAAGRVRLTKHEVIRPMPAVAIGFGPVTVNQYLAEGL